MVFRAALRSYEQRQKSVLKAEGRGRLGRKAEVMQEIVGNGEELAAWPRESGCSVKKAARIGNVLENPRRPGDVKTLRIRKRELLQ